MPCPRPRSPGAITAIPVVPCPFINPRRPTLSFRGCPLPVFLGVSVLVREQVYGGLYLTGKAGDTAPRLWSPPWFGCRHRR